jgi:hypothetical protein
MSLRKKLASQCSESFHTAEQKLEGIETMDTVRKGQVKILIGKLPF